MITDVRASQMFLLLHEAESVVRIAGRLKMSEKTVRKYRDADQLPSQIKRAERSYRTREDPHHHADIKLFIFSGCQTSDNVGGKS